MDFSCFIPDKHFGVPSVIFLFRISITHAIEKIQAVSILFMFLFMILKFAICAQKKRLGKHEQKLFTLRWCDFLRVFF